MFRRFLRDTRGNYMLMTAIAIVPIMGALALGVDYTEMNRQQQAMQNALDAANLAAGRHLQAGASETEVLAYARDFFDANLGPVDPSDATLTTVLPSNTAGGGTLKSTGCLHYKPYFYPTFVALLNNSDGANTISVCAQSEIRLKNTLEVALVLDNSTSMNERGSGSGKKRLALLQEAAKQLVDTIADQAGMIKQVNRPVQFGIVPFAASVNVGDDYENALWMDRHGLSPVHYENLNVSTTSSVTIGTNKKIEFSDGYIRKTGTGWPSLERNTIFTRFTLFDDIKHYTNSRQTTSTKTFKWGGCVEARPSPYNVSDAAPTSATPSTLFVPMFAPDEAGEAWMIDQYTTLNAFGAPNSWWNDVTTNTSALTRQTFLKKYYTIRPYDNATPRGKGPNYSCTTTPITPLTDVTTTAGRTAIKGAIDGMVADGATNVPEGIAWGWRVLSSAEPFTQGRKETEKGNDKVVIVLTDGANTYYTPSWLGFGDGAGNKSTYSAHAYAKTGRIFSETSVSSSTFTNANYTKAMNEHFAKLCDNAKEANVIVMTVSLDLSEKDTTEKAQIEALKSCASFSRFRKDTTDPSKPAKLFWNATGGDLAQKFKEIADELSNLRIVS